MYSNISITITNINGILLFATTPNIMQETVTGIDSTANVPVSYTHLTLPTKA